MTRWCQIALYNTQTQATHFAGGLPLGTCMSSMKKEYMHETDDAGGGGRFFKTRCERAEERWSK